MVRKKDSGQKFVESVSESDGALQRAPALELILALFLAFLRDRVPPGMTSCRSPQKKTMLIET